MTAIRIQKGWGSYPITQARVEEPGLGLIDFRWRG